MKGEVNQSDASCPKVFASVTVSTEFEPAAPKFSRWRDVSNYMQGRLKSQDGGTRRRSKLGLLLEVIDSYQV